MKIRIIKTASNAKAVQIVSYKNNKRIVLQHIGSAHTDETLNDLKILAEEWIKDYNHQLSIFPDENPNRILHLNHSAFIGVKYHFFYKLVRSIQEMLKLDDLPVILNDLVVIRIFEPASKLRSLELLEQFFGICHSRKTYYKIAPNCINLKNLVEQKVVNFAKTHYSFNFDILFYDVTTLYFETFEEDDLRMNGFSKDNKSQQPQILIALIPNFPLEPSRRNVKLKANRFIPKFSNPCSSIHLKSHFHDYFVRVLFNICWNSKHFIAYCR